MAKLSNLSGEFLQMLNANEAYSIYRRMLTESMTSPGPRYCSHLQDARRRPCTAELLQGAKRTSVRITQRRSPPWTTLPRSWSSRGSWLRLGWGLPGEGWPSWRTLHIFGLTKAWGLHFLLVSRYWWNDVTSDSFMQLFIIVAGFFVCICTCFCFPHLLTMCPPSAKSHESIVTLYHTLKRVHQTWRISRFTIPAGNCVASEVTNRIVLPT